MKRTFIILVMVLLGGVIYLQAKPVALTYDDHSTTAPGSPKTPIRPWIIDLTNNVISMEATPCDYTLNLYDEDEDVVYSVFVPAGTTQVVLPTTLSGSFELRFETDTYYYYGFIYL